jgi:DNA adenine methylase
MVSALKRASRAVVIEGDNGVRPPLKWAGGKRWLVSHLRHLWQQGSHARLVEPFCGGLAVTLGLLPERALLNDINPHAINFYQWLRKGLTIRLQMQNDEEVYYRLRERFNQLVTAGKANSHESASLFYYLNRTGYNGLCRFNRAGEFNVPFGRYSAINYRSDFTDYRPICSNWKFASGDFQKMDIEASDFIYADPPYDVEFTSYAKEGFSWDDQERLAVWLSRHPGPVILSNQATKRIVKLYRSLGFRLEFLDAPRMISCTGNREKAKEVLALRGVG